VILNKWFFKVEKEFFTCLLIKQEKIMAKIENLEDLFFSFWRKMAFFSSVGRRSFA